jgi:autotransporter-associated beta strand protein
MKNAMKTSILCRNSVSGRSPNTRSSLIAFVAAAALAVAPAPSQAAPVTWDAGGGATTTWDTGANWDPSDTVPAATDDVFFGTGGSAANLNGAQTANSITLNRNGNFTISDSTGSSSGLTLTSGNLTADDPDTTARVYNIDSNITLGNNGTWTLNRASGGNLTVNGIIKGSFGITASLTGSNAVLNLTGANTFTGGLTFSTINALVNLRNASALGTGDLTIKDSSGFSIAFGGSTSGNAESYAENGIVYDAAGTRSGSGVFTVDTNVGTKPQSVTFGSFTGAIGAGQNQIFRSLDRTLIFGEGFAATGLNANGLLLNTSLTSGTGTYIFQKELTSAFYNFTAADGTGTANLLFDVATGTVSKNITVGTFSATGVNTVGVIKATGTTTLSGALTITNSSGATALNLVSREAAARAKWTGVINDSTSTVGIRVNESYSDNVNGTNTPLGTVEFTKDNTYDGGTDVFAGTLLLSNTSSGSATGTGNVSVRAGATLGGTGFSKPVTGSKITVLSGGFVAPGDGGIGTLSFSGTSTTGTVATFETGAKFKFDLNASTVTSDILASTSTVAGDFEFNDNVIDFTTLAGSLANGQTYTLFTATTGGATGYAGLTLDGNNHITDGLFIGTGLGGLASESFLAVSGNDIVLNVVPEPQTWAMLLGGFGMLLAFQRNRRRIAG